MRAKDIAKADELALEADVIVTLLARTDISDAVRENCNRELASILAELKKLGAQ